MDYNGTSSHLARVIGTSMRGHSNVNLTLVITTCTLHFESRIRYCSAFTNSLKSPYSAILNAEKQIPVHDTTMCQNMAQHYWTSKKLKNICFQIIDEIKAGYELGKCIYISGKCRI